MKKYGLELRVPPSQQKKAATRPPLPPPVGFRDDDDDDEDRIEREITRQASKNKALKETEEQHRKALEEDPTVFDYDGVYDEMKQKTIQPKAQDRLERKPKYIQNLLKKAEQRQREHEIVYERKLAKERSKEDHLYADKDKFVTGSYKRKLAEQAKWMEEERLRELREEREDVTKKSDLSDFYFNLEKNVAYGGRGFESRREKQIEPKQPQKQAEPKQQEGHAEPRQLERHSDSRLLEEHAEARPLEKHVEARLPEKHADGRVSTNVNLPETSGKQEERQAKTSSTSGKTPEPIVQKQASDASGQEEAPVRPPSTDGPKGDHHKRSGDAIAAAKERFLARKRAKEQ